MGKALIFSGIKVDNPLSIVTFIKRNITAQDYVDDYKSVVSTITEEQETAIKSFIETLIINDIWDKVERCYPMLGGIGYYTYDLKRITNQHNWDFPDHENGVSWDGTRNAPYLNIAGNKKGKDIIIQNLDCINKGCCFLLSCKNNSLRVECAFAGKYNKDLPTFLTKALINSQGGYTKPTWCTAQDNTNLPNFNAKDKNANANFLLNIGGGKNRLYCWSADYKPIFAKEDDTDISQSTTDAVIGIGGHFAVEAERPAANTLNGCVNLFMAFNKKLSESEISVLAKAVYDFNQSCGRYIDFD